MARNVAEAATGAEEIATNIVGVADAASNNAVVLGQVQGHVTQLAELSHRLRVELTRFSQ